MSKHQYRLYPTRAQQTALSGMLGTLRDVYNSLLHERKFLHEQDTVQDKIQGLSEKVHTAVDVAGDAVNTIKESVKN